MNVCVFTVIWVLTILSMIFGRNIDVVVDWENGLRIYLERRRSMTKKGKNPSRRVKELLASRKLNPANWLVVRDDTDFIDVKNKDSGCVRRLAK